MKTVLTREQSDKLLELGVPADKAGITLHNVQFTHTTYIFTLTDLLQILPNNIRVENNDYRAYLEISAVEDNLYYVSYEYVEFGGAVEIKNASELIDALYELLLWVIEEGYLKF